jgi:hypothetical protein
MAKRHMAKRECLIHNFTEYLDFRRLWAIPTFQYSKDEAVQEVHDLLFTLQNN